MQCEVLQGLLHSRVRPKGAFVARLGDTALREQVQTPYGKVVFVHGTQIEGVRIGHQAGADALPEPCPGIVELASLEAHLASVIVSLAKMLDVR